MVAETPTAWSSCPVIGHLLFSCFPAEPSQHFLRFKSFPEEFLETWPQSVAFGHAIPSIAPIKFD
jgi:hypothetical protein